MDATKREAREGALRAIGRRVREARESRGLKITQLADQAGVKRQVIYDFEDGARISIPNVVAVARALGISTDWLLGLQVEEHEPEPAPIDNTAERRRRPRLILPSEAAEAAARRERAARAFARRHPALAARCRALAAEARAMAAGEQG